MKSIILIVLFYALSISTQAQEVPISLLNYGIVCIGDQKEYLGEHKWTLDIFFSDSIYVIDKNSTNQDTFLFFDINTYKNKYDQSEILITIKKDNKLVFQKKILYPNVENQGYYLSPAYYDNNNQIRGQIIDSYKVNTERDEYLVVRSNYLNQYICWYLLKNNSIINIHTEERNNKKWNQKIVVSDINEDGIPEFNFYHKNEKNQQKLIHFIEKNKFIAIQKNKMISYSSNTLDYNNLITRGFLHYSLK